MCTHVHAPHRAALQAVNEWVSNATRGKIDEIVNQDIVDQATLLLINALYFKGLWEVPFDK